jgi:hypothetical protein
MEQGAGIKVRNGRRAGIQVRGEKSSNTSEASKDRITNVERKVRRQVRKGRSRKTGEEEEGRKDRWEKEGASIQVRKRRIWNTGTEVKQQKYRQERKGQEYR